MRTPRRRVAALAATVAVLPAVAVTLVNGPTASAETAISTGGMTAAPFGTDGRIDVFTRLSNGALGHQILRADGVWTSLESLGGVLTSQPSAASQGLNKLAVVARDSRGATALKTYDAGWHAWASVGGTTNAAPAISSWGGGRLDVWVRGTDNGLYHRRFESGRWFGWERLYGRLGSGPAAASWGPGRLDVVTRGTDGAVWWRHWDSSTGRWSGWTSLGGAVLGEASVTATGTGSLDVFARGTNGRLYTRTLRPGTGWSSWQYLAGALTSSPGATSTAADTAAVFARGTDNRYYWRQRTGTTWSGWRVVDAASSFHRLGMWVSVYEYATTRTTTPLDPQQAVTDMAARGARTLYLQTGRFTSTGTFEDAPRMALWLQAAHAHGMRVVGWYVPDYFTHSGTGDNTTVSDDIARTVAIATYVSPAGQRFDAVGIDIEYPWSIPSGFTAAQWNSLVTQQLAGVRSRTRVPVGAIVVPPVLMDLNMAPTSQGGGGNTGRWTGFPWSSVSRYTDVVVPMIYWTGSLRTRCTNGQTLYCVGPYVSQNIARLKSLTGLPVHAIGGEADGDSSTPFTTTEVRDFVNATRSSGGIGGSVWTYKQLNGLPAATRDAMWQTLRGLNTL